MKAYGLFKTVLPYEPHFRKYAIFSLQRINGKLCWVYNYSLGEGDFNKNDYIKLNRRLTIGQFIHCYVFEESDLCKR